MDTKQLGAALNKIFDEENEIFNDPIELAPRIVPENDSLLLFVEDLVQGFVEMFCVHG